jgi:hypothetical protein
VKSLELQLMTTGRGYRRVGFRLRAFSRFEAARLSLSYDCRIRQSTYWTRLMIRDR